MTQEQAIALKEILVPGGALWVLLQDLEAENAEVAKTVARLDFEDAESAPAARKLQGTLRGFDQCIDRIKDLINERSLED